MFDEEEDYVLTSQILSCCYEVMKELGVGFLEKVYKNSLVISLRKSGLTVEVEKAIDVYYHSQNVGYYQADIVVNNSVIVELKCVKAILPEHKAQLINYLKATGIPTGLLVNFSNRTLEHKRLYNPTKRLHV